MTRFNTKILCVVAGQWHCFMMRAQMKYGEYSIISAIILHLRLTLASASGYFGD